MTVPGKNFDPPPDGDEVRAFLAGDVGAFERLVDRHQRAVLSLCQRLVGAPDAKDLFQEVFLQAWRALPQLRAPGAFRTWLFRITIRKGRRRQQKRRDPDEVADADAVPASTLADAVEQEEECARLRTRLSHLPPRQREVVLLRHYQELSFAQIAAALDISEEAARANHYQGLRRLRRELAEDGPAKS